MTRNAHRAISSVISLFIVASVSATTPPATSPAPSASATPSALQQEIAQLRALQKKVQDELLTPSPNDQQDFADYLKNPDTGLIKILPRGDHPELGLNGGGAYYSFLLKTNEYGHGSDIELQSHRLTCGFAGGDYGYFLPLGDVPIKHAAFVTADAVPEWLDADAA